MLEKIDGQPHERTADVTTLSDGAMTLVVAADNLRAFAEEGETA